MNGNRMGLVVGTFSGESDVTHSNRKTTSNLPYTEGIKLGAGEEIYEEEVDLDLDGIGEVGDRASEGQVFGVYVLHGLSHMDRSWGVSRIEVNSDQKLVEVRGMAGGN